MPTLSYREPAARSSTSEHRCCRHDKTTMNAHYPSLIWSVAPIQFPGVSPPGPGGDWPWFFYHHRRVVVNPIVS